MFSPISRASSLALRLLTVVSCRAQLEQPSVQKLLLVQLPLNVKVEARRREKQNLGSFVFSFGKMPGLAYKIGEKLVLLGALHVFLITHLQALCYSVQTVEHSSIYQRATERQSSASNVATSNRYPVLTIITG